MTLLLPAMCLNCVDSGRWVAASAEQHHRNQGFLKLAMKFVYLSVLNRARGLVVMTVYGCDYDMLWAVNDDQQRKKIQRKVIWVLMEFFQGEVEATLDL